MKNKFNDLTLDELKAKREEFIKRQRELRFDMVLGHVENPLEKRTVRKQIARINTMIHQQNADKG